MRRHGRDRKRTIREASRVRADRTSGWASLVALPSTLPVGIKERPAPVKLRATLPACAWAKRREVKITTGEKAAISKTATPDAIQFSVVSLSVGETSAETTRRKPTYTAVATTNLD